MCLLAATPSWPVRSSTRVCILIRSPLGVGVPGILGHFPAPPTGAPELRSWAELALQHFVREHFVWNGFQIQSSCACCLLWWMRVWIKIQGICSKRQQNWRLQGRSNLQFWSNSGNFWKIWGPGMLFYFGPKSFILFLPNPVGWVPNATI